MFGLGTKIFGGLSIALALYIAYDEIKIARLEVNVATLQANEDKLTDAIAKTEAREKIDKQLLVASIEREHDLKSDLSDIRLNNSLLSNEINNLRMRENAKALQQPFERGSAAGLRMGNTWLRFEGAKDRDNPNPEDTTPDNQ